MTPDSRLQKEFRLTDGSSIRVQQIMRELPGRRLACQAQWQGKNVFAKLFFGKNARKYSERDANGSKAVAERGLLTPTLLLEGELENCEGRAVIYEWIAGRNAEEVWHASTLAERRKLGDELVTIVALLHEAGLLQTDMYLRNFLVADHGIHVLDGDGIRRYAQPLAKRGSQANLAQLLSKFDVLEEESLPQWLRRYLEARGWPVDTISLQTLRSKVHAVRRKVAVGYAYSKVLRNCTDVAVERDWKRYVAVNRDQDTPSLRQLIARPDSHMNAASSQRLKEGNTCTVALVNDGERNLVIKRYNIKNFWHGLSRALRRTRARNSWSNSYLLQFYGIDTAAPLALVERRWGWLRRESYFIASHVKGVPVVEALTGAPRQQRGQIANQLAQLLYKLYLLRIEHGDMKASNLLLQGGKPVLLDLDAMRQHGCGWRFRRRHARDLRRLLKNWENAPDTQQLLITALQEQYRGDPVLALAGIGYLNTSENK